MPLVLEAIGGIDRPHVPPSGDPALSTYKEWWHFNIIDDAAGLDVIVNLSLTGDIRTGDEGQANLIFLSLEADRGWRGGLDVFDGLSATVDERGVDLAVGQSSIRYSDGCYRLWLRSANGQLAADLRLVPATEPMLVWKDTPIGSGHINWMIVPYLSASGWVRIGERRVSMEGARAYHDHNWGHWHWGDNFGWDWGFCAAATELGGEPLSLVYDRTVDRRGARVAEHSLAVWRGEQLLRFFARQMIRVRHSGTYRGHVRRIPGVSNLMDPARVATIPARIDLTARFGEDLVEASYIPDAALQIAIPRETGFGLVELNETMGWLTLAGTLAGWPFNVTRRACFEFVG